MEYERDSRRLHTDAPSYEPVGRDRAVVEKGLTTVCYVHVPMNLAHLYNQYAPIKMWGKPALKHKQLLGIVCMPTIPAVKKPRQEDCYKFEASLGSM